MYYIDRWDLGDTIEYEIKFKGKYGAKGEKRSKKEKPTPEAVKRQNQRNKEKKMRRLIQANFKEGDLWMTLKYPKGHRSDAEEVKADIRAFIESLRRKFKKLNEELKFIYRVEVGKQGGIHIHMIIPRIRGADTELMVQRSWKKGRVNFQSLDDGDYDELAKYITKPPDEEVNNQLSMFPEEERKEFIKYSSSRNLIRPEPVRKEYSRKTVRKLITEGPKATKGYYIVKDSISQGINPYTGMSYFHYRERRLRDGQGQYCNSHHMQRSG